ncbi:MAG: GFA family protein [Rhizobiaceae bacterium]|nr:GFA family protein [Rhizobiaceae bacterium]
MAKGSCLCGGVNYEVNGPLRPITVCHCTQCRKQTGHFYAATATDADNLVIRGEENLTWFHASKDAERGFCKTCGSALFWRHSAEKHISILAGSLDGETGLKIEKHIFVADKGDYYEIEDDAPQTP